MYQLNTYVSLAPPSLRTAYWTICRLMVGLLAAPVLGLAQPATSLLNEADYYERPGLNVMAFQDFYPDGHQGGITVIQNGIRVLANGDLRLEPAPGQWSPVPKKGKTTIDRSTQEISVQLWYPDSSKDRTGFNPIIYPDFRFRYTVRIIPENDAFRVSVDLEKPLPEEWVGKVGFNIELFPGFYFGKTYQMDGQTGRFPRQFTSDLTQTEEGALQIAPMAVGKQLQLVPEHPHERITFEAIGQDLILLDGRGEHNNGWFIVRTLAQAGKTTNAVELLIQPEHQPDFVYEPVIQVSQVGYHPKQPKVAVIELDKQATPLVTELYRIDAAGPPTLVQQYAPQRWGEFLRYQYLQVDFSDITQSGMYELRYGDQRSHPFRIDPDIYEQQAWQPTLEYYLPVQMCHMRINDRYKVWHGLCHEDDARMAPTDLNHFDGYKQGPSTLTSYAPYDPVPGLNMGGWHDAGDYDLRVESQATTVLRLAQIWELFGTDYDITTVDQEAKVVEMHRPDGVPDLLQQIEHGVLTIVGGYEALGRLYRGIICPSLRQYTLLGDAASMTDNRVFDATRQPESVGDYTYGKMDDRWVFTEENPRRELQVAACLAAASRALSGYKPELATRCLRVALDIWDQYKGSEQLGVINLAVELWLTTSEATYREALEARQEQIVAQAPRVGASLAKVAQRLQGTALLEATRKALAPHAQGVKEEVAGTPFGVSYTPNIWGAGWGIQSFGVTHYFLHQGFPDLFPIEPVYNALNFVLGVHPGSNNASFVSGVGAKSITVAYGVNRDEWSYIPGGSVSGTALIRPDFPELKEWPYFWQQTEYVMGGGATNYLFLVLATRDRLRGSN